ncbi:Na/Pi cotransporter family protein [Acetobacteraceae bacterium H6797]|nr:Na/Pi cotransporter family protein [Acetobacteraceae bacterium H6797]
MTGNGAGEFRLVLELAGEAALLLWGLHMVQSGVQRAFGARLRQGLGVALGDRWRAFLVGLGVTAALQSSTATAFMVGSFAAGGVLPLVPALATMLGANVGTALIVQALSFDAGLLFPPLMLAGLIGFRRGGRWRDIGRAGIGLGLMLLALHLMIESIAPLQASPTLRQALGLLSGLPLIDMALAAFIAWATHSSVAAVVLIASFAGAGAIGVEGALAMVLGANLGTSLNPLLAARGQGTSPARLRVPLGNLINRAIGCAVALPLLPWIAQGLLALDPSPARVVAHAHLGFNLALALLTLPLLDPLAALLRRLLPSATSAEDPSRPRYLDEAAIANPPQALANAARESLRIADMLESMLRLSARAFAPGGDRDAARQAGQIDEAFDRLHRALHAYLGRLPETLNPEEARRLAEIRDFAVNLEHAADAVAHNLVRQAARLAKQGIALMPEDAAEIASLHEGALSQLSLAITVFMQGDEEAARSLVLQKERLRGVERQAAARLGRASLPGDAGQAADLHLDAVRDLRRIAGYLAAIGHPLLQRLGALRSSRLAGGDD